MFSHHQVTRFDALS